MLYRKNFSIDFSISLPKDGASTFGRMTLIRMAFRKRMSFRRMALRLRKMTLSRMTFRKRMKFRRMALRMTLSSMTLSRMTFRK
jgi:hypothetical protein